MLPKEHIVDTNYAESKQFVESQQQYGIDLIAPGRTDNKWQSKEQRLVRQLERLGFEVALTPVAPLA